MTELNNTKRSVACSAIGVASDAVLMRDASRAVAASPSSDPSSDVGAGRRRLTPLLRRVLIINTVVLCAGPLVTGLVAASGHFATGPAVAAALPLMVLWAVNFYLLRGAVAPLRRLSALADRVNLHDPGPQLELESRTAEVVVLTDAINRMLARLQQEQRSSTRRAIAVQEAERKRIARELHDEVGQTLTGVLLEIGEAARIAPPELRDRLTETLESARSSLQDVRRIAVELRPEALDELGLPGALVALCDRLSQSGDLAVERDIQRDLPPLTEEQELAIYRIAQEALTNVVRHSGSQTAHLTLRADGGGVSLIVADHGRGVTAATPGTGITGMHERASLIGASLSVADGPAGGSVAALNLPIAASHDP